MIELLMAISAHRVAEAEGPHLPCTPDDGPIASCHIQLDTMKAGTKLGVVKPFDKLLQIHRAFQAATNGRPLRWVLLATTGVGRSDPIRSS